MLKPTVQVHNEKDAMVAEFWDCLRLDPAPVKEIRSKYEAHLRSNGRPMLVVDLLGVGFAGSAALGLFVTLQRLVRQSGGQIIFCNVDPTVHEVFRISKLDSIFVFVSDRPAALARAASHAQAADAVRTPAQEPTATPPPETGPSRNSGTERLLPRHRRRKL
jgi:stage II sporulation protein AA (anti-sigma F factor antagonist)